jgi:hypothetical protein
MGRGWKSLEEQARKSLECCKQTFMGNFDETLKTRRVGN